MAVTIETFGNVVAGGNIVVGLVVFLIITVVQFIVVAKGAELVEEVARFTLDGMPGKQMSIDSTYVRVCSTKMMPRLSAVTWRKSQLYCVPRIPP